MEQGYYSVIATPREALYEAACAMDKSVELRHDESGRL